MDTPYGFLFKIYPCAAWDYTGPPEIAPTRPFLRAQARLPPCFPGLPLTRATAPPETQKGGRISPAASSVVRCYRTGKP